VDTETWLVATVKLALDEPAGTVKPGGTIAAGLLLDTDTYAPPAGAAALSVRVA
jgi:hypothetical protein